MCARGEALGGRLIAWSAALFAMAWETDSIEEAFELATSVREESSPPGRAWTCGIAEGELELFAPDGQRMHLAWGEALRSAASLARVAKAGEVLVDGDVRALRAGQLGLIGARSATDAGQRVRGWRLDLERPWKRGAPGLEFREASDSAIVMAADDIEVDEVDETEPADTTQPMPAVDFSDDELSTSDVLQVIEAAERQSFEEEPSTSARRREGTLADRVRALSRHDKNRDPVVAIADLRRARARAERSAPTVRCQAALALAMTLSIAGRIDDALLEALDALASARVAQDKRAVGASIALLSKLYAGAGFPDAAKTLKETAGSA